MKRNPVDSTCVRAIGYDSVARLLEVEFTSRTVYEYLEVPEAVYGGFVSADSHGRYFNQWIKGHYDYRRIS